MWLWGASGIHPIDDTVEAVKWPYESIKQKWAEYTWARKKEEQEGEKEKRRIQISEIRMKYKR